MTPIRTYLEKDREGRGSTPLRLQPATGFQKAIFKHSCFSPLRAYVNLDTDRLPFAPKIACSPISQDQPLSPKTTVRKRRITKSPHDAIRQLLGPDGHGRGAFALTDPPILISHQNRGRNGDRRIRPDQNADDQCEAEAAKHLATEQIECKHGKEGQARLSRWFDLKFG